MLSKLLLFFTLGFFFFSPQTHSMHSEEEEASPLVGKAMKLLDSIQCNDDYKALQIFVSEAQKGNALASFWLGVMHSNGRGRTPSSKTALYWWARAENAAFPDAAIAVQLRANLFRGLERLREVHPRVVDLSHVNFNIRLMPLLIEGLQGVQELYMEHTLFGDEHIKIISSNLPKTDLDFIDLRGNLISDVGAETIASQLHLSKLRRVALGQNQIADRGAIALAHALSESHIEILSLEENKISAEGCRAFEHISSTSRLRILDLGRNVIERGALPVILGIQNLSTFYLLDLAGSHINDGDVSHLSSVLPRSNLGALDIKCNALTDSSLEALIPAVQNSRLQILNMRSNCFTEKGFLEILPVLPQTFLSYLNLQGCHFPDVEGVNFPPTLQELNLSKTRISSRFLRSFASSLGILNLKMLNLSVNNFPGDVVTPLRELFSNSSIENLTLEACVFDEGMLLGAVSDLQLSTSYRVLTLSGIPLRGQLRNLGSFSGEKLTEIFLANCSLIVEDMDGFLSYFPALQKIDLSNNQISDEGVLLLSDSGKSFNLQEIILNNVALKKIDSLLPLQSSAPNLLRLSVKLNRELALEELKDFSIPMIDCGFALEPVLSFRDLSFSTDLNTREDGLYRTVYEFSVTEDAWRDLEFQDIQILSETNYDDLPPPVRERLGMNAREKNILLRVTFRAPRTASKLDLNNKMEALYRLLHRYETRYM